MAIKDRIPTWVVEELRRYLVVQVADGVRYGVCLAIGAVGTYFLHYEVPVSKYAAIVFGFFAVWFLVRALIVRIRRGGQTWRTAAAIGFVCVGLVAVLGLGAWRELPTPKKPIHDTISRINLFMPSNMKNAIENNSDVTLTVKNVGVGCLFPDSCPQGAMVAFPNSSPGSVVRGNIVEDNKTYGNALPQVSLNQMRRSMRET
jgi:hypothetical protein